MRLVFARRRILILTPLPCPHSPWAATTIRKICGGRRRSSEAEPHDANHQNFLVLGPWRHGSWNSSARHLGNLDYTEPIGKEFRAQIEAKFFAHYLKDEPGFDLEDTASFQTGSNTWKRYSHFPPAAVHGPPACILRRGPARLDDSTAAGADQLFKRSRQSSSLSPSAHSADLQRRLAVVQLAHRRSALRHRSQGRGRVEAARAQAGSDVDRRGDRRHLCLDHRHGQRPGRQAHRRVSRPTIPTRRCAATSS